MEKAPAPSESPTTIPGIIATDPAASADRCAACGQRPLVWADGRLVCPKPFCTGGSS
jgi:hypothetical protein